MRSGIRRNRRGRWCEKGVKDSDEIPDKEICHSQGYCTVCGPFRLTRRCSKVTPQITQTNLFMSRPLVFHCKYSIGRDIPVIRALEIHILPRHGCERSSGKSGARDGELIHSKSSFTPPHPTTPIVTLIRFWSRLSLSH